MIRRIIGKFTSPLFVPLRKLVVWGDNKFGTCNYVLSIEPRTYESDVPPVQEYEDRL